MMGEHRSDAIFALPRLPRTARVVGTLPGWREGLSARGVEVVHDGGETVPDLLVARSADALGEQVPAVILDGAPAATGALRRGGRATRRLLPLPRFGDPQLLLDLDHNRAAGYALSHTVMPSDRARIMKRKIAGVLAGARLFPPSRSLITVGSMSQEEPALLQAARAVGVPPGCSWFLVVAKGTVDKRSVFILFEDRARTPSYVLKFSRAARLAVRTERDERGLKCAEQAGGRVAAHAPRFLGRFDADGLVASVETAAVGHSLASLISRALTRTRRLAPVEQVARWLIDMAVETAQPPDALSAERERLQREVLPAWAARGVPADIVASLPPVPAVFQHGDLWEENVIVDSRGNFTLLDWELARPDGFPLWDLFRYAIHLLSVIDGAAHRRVEYTTELFSGRAPSSPVAFRWVRNMVRALELPRDAVGRIVTLYLVHHASLARSELARLETAHNPTEHVEQLWLERAAEAWLAHPELGPGWTAWES